jgi:hypothetical protein
VRRYGAAWSNSKNKQVTIVDRRGLEGVAEFDASYLYLDRRKL